MMEADISSVHTLLATNGWDKRIGSAKAFWALIAASQVAVVAIADGEVVGFIRALSDGQSNGYLSMLVVAESYRRQGIGRTLVEHVLGLNAQMTWVLRAGRDGAAEFFATLGFEHSSIAMERRRS